MTADEQLIVTLKAIQECDVPAPRVMLLDSLEWSLSWDPGELGGLWVLIDHEGAYWTRGTEWTWGTESGHDLASLLAALKAAP